MVFQLGNKLAKLKGKNKKTLEKEEALRLYQNEIIRNLQPLIRAQFDVAQGLTIMYQRKLQKDKTGKLKRTGEFVRVTNSDRIQELLEGDCKGDNYYYITTKDPNPKALEDLFNRAFGKSVQPIANSEEKPFKIMVLPSDIIGKNKIEVNNATMSDNAIPKPNTSPENNLSRPT